MSPEAYLKSVVPEPFRVLGFQLRPLSIGHIVLMEWAGLSYLQADRAPALADLVNACVICSHTFRGYQELLKSDDLIPMLKLAGKGLDLAALEQKLSLFSQYLDAGTTWPDFEMVDNSTPGVVVGAPWLQCLRTMLMSRLHVGSDEVWDYPYRLALWDCLSLREADGKLAIIGEDNSEERMERVAAMGELNEEIRQVMGLTTKSTENT